MSFFNKKSKSQAPEFNLIDADTPFAIKQAYRALYTNVLYLDIDKKCKKIAVTSPLPAECKSTVSSNLALVLAENLEDKRILIIDSDMRSPKIWKLFDSDRKAHGLSEFLAGIDEEPNIQSYRDTRLSFISAGGQTVNPTKLIGSQRMKKLLDICEERFDYVIIDTPPMNIVSDAFLLGNVIDGYIISARSDCSDVNSLAECLENIENIGAEVLGLVLSDVKMKSGAHHYGKYGKYARYSAYEKDV